MKINKDLVDATLMLSFIILVLVRNDRLCKRGDETRIDGNTCRYKYRHGCFAGALRSSGASGWRANGR